MSRGFPSMTALLGLLAIAGYQNRDKLAEMLGGAGPKGPSGATPGQQGGFGHWAMRRVRPGSRSGRVVGQAR